MRYNKAKRKVSSVLACAVICGTATMPQASVGHNVNAQLEEQLQMGQADRTTAAGIEISATTGSALNITEVRAIQLTNDSYLNISEIEDMEIKTPTEIGRFTIYPGPSDSSNIVTVEVNSKTADDGTAFTKRLKLNGTGKENLRAIAFNTTGKAKLTVYAMSGSSSAERQLNLYNSATNQVVKTFTMDKTQVIKQEVELTEAGDYHLVSENSGVNVYGVLLEEASNYKETVFNADTLKTGTLSSGTTAHDLGNSFSVYGEVSVDAKANTATDGEAFTQCLNLKGTGSKESRSLHFTTTDKAEVEIYAVSGSNTSDRTLGVYTAEGTLVDSITAYGTKVEPQTVKLDEAGTYYIASTGSGINIHQVKVMEGEKPAEIVRPDWSTVATPVLTKVDYKEGTDDTIQIDFELETSTEAADKATVKIEDAQGNEVASILVGKSAVKEKTATFKPSASGTYKVTVYGQRNGETEEKESNSIDFDFKLPLTASEVSAANKGGGDVLVKWTGVKEAEKYVVEYKKVGETEYQVGAEVTADAELEAMLTGLEAEETYHIRVVAVRGDDQKASADLSFKVKDRIEREWAYTYFGQSSSSSLNTMEIVDQENLTVKLNSCTSNADGSINKKGGKFTTFHDGLTFYYTEVDAAKENFTLTATFTVDYINPTPDGQEGFGILAMDSLGEHGVSSKNHYTNSAGVIATKFDVEVDGVKTSLKDTLGARFVSGITPDVLNGGDSAIAQAGKNVSTAFSTSADDLIKQGGTYTLTLRKSNTGYHAIVHNEVTGEQTEKIMYSPEKLLQLDGDKVYVGFAAARGCNVTVSDIEMTTIAPELDDEVIPEPEEFATLKTKIDSPSTTGDANYNFTFNANLPGDLTVEDAAGNKVIDSVKVKQDTDYTAALTLQAGNNDYTVTFKPEEESRTADGLRIESYEAVTMKHSVTLKAFEADTIYVSPQGTSSGTGTVESPVDIHTATNYVRAGQTIVLANGTYDMTSSLVIARGIDGTESAPITLRSEEGGRAILNFKNANGGMQLWGSYWHIIGIDVCETPGNIKGLQVAGHYNVIEQVDTYRNGDTGLQISGTSTEGFDKWPSNNLILNCSSYDNIDPGENNADGFAAKITCGEGNVFRGCAAFNNLDDGWDLFAKIESGPIGAVTIEDSIAFNNGTLTTGYGSGDGNGFKLGGDGIAVKHVLKNSISFNNNTNGITSNSNPAAILINNTAYGNKGANISLYGKGTGDRDFVAENNISMAGKSADIYSEMPSLASDNNYFWDGVKSVNQSGKELKSDIFENVDVANYTIKRHADGSIDMGDLLKLNSKAPEGIGAVLPGEEVAPSTSRTWEFGKGNFADINLQGEGAVATIEDIMIDATSGKFYSVGRSDVQINPGTIVKIPVSGPCEISFEHGYSTGTMTFTDEAGNVLTHKYDSTGKWATDTVVLEDAVEGYVTLQWETGSKFYLKNLTTKQVTSQKMTLEVGPTRTYKTVQSALDAIEYTPTEKSRVTLAIDPGIYEEEVTVTKPCVTFKNADPSKGEVKITYDKASGHDSDSSKNFGTQQTASVTIAQTATGFEAYDVTFENSYNLNQANLGDDASARKQTQAVAVVTLADRIIFENCKFIGRQDTLYLKGASKGQTSPEVNEARVYLKDCYIEGTVDFIFGDSTAVFENCELRMAYYTNGGHYTAANTNLSSLGYVFNKCKLTIDEAYKEYIDEATGQFKVDDKTGKPVKNIDLGRPWQADHTYPYYGSQSVFIDCMMDPAIKQEGWSTWDANTVTNKVRYMEYGSTDLNGQAVDLTKRAAWSRILKEEQAAAYNTVNVLRGSDNWNPSNGTLGEVQVADITLDTYRAEIPQGETLGLNAKVLPVEVNNKAFTFKSSNEAVATVDETGKVTAISEGTAIITATTVENGCSVAAEIKVLPSRTKVPTVKEIKIESNETILPGDVLTGTYSYELEADNAKDNAKVQWYVVDPVTGDEILVQEGTESFDRSYKVTSGDIGYQIKFVVIPETTTSYGDTGEAVSSAATVTVTKPDYAVPTVYVREPFTSFIQKYESVSSMTATSESEWIGANVAKGGITDRTGLTLLHTGEKDASDKMAWKVVDTSGKATDHEAYNGNATVASTIEYQNDASILMYNAKETWTNYTANARVRFSPLATGFSAASYWDMYICYDAASNSGYKVRISRGGNTSSAVITLYKVVEGIETQVAKDDTTLSNALKQNAGEENPFFRVEMSHNAGDVTAKVYFEGTGDKAVALSFKDEAPLAGTVAFENFGKSGCPLVDMLTVEEILKEEPEEKPEEKPEDQPGDSDDDDSWIPSGGSASKPSTPSVESTINNALTAGKTPEITVIEGKVNLTNESIEALIAGESDLVIRVNDKVSMVVPVETLKEQNSAITINAALPAQDKLTAISTALKANDTLTGIQANELAVTVGVESSKTVVAFDEPIQMTFAVAKNLVQDANALTAVRYDVLEDGTVKVVKIGGAYDAEKGIYTFLTDKPGTFGLVEAKELTKVTLVVGDVVAMINGQAVVNDVAPEITDGRTMLPVRLVAEALGAEVGYKSRRVTIALADTEISFKVGENLEGYGIAPYIKEGRTYISARWVAENLGANVLWVPSAKTVEIVK